MNTPMIHQSKEVPRRVGEIVNLLEQTGSEPVVLKGIDPQKWVVVGPKLVGRVMCTSLAGAEGETRAFINPRQLQKGFCHGTEGSSTGDWNNFGGIERIWFTPPHRVTPNNTKLVPPLVGPRRRGHIIMGSIEGIVFIVGWFLVVAGFAVLGTRGYGSF